MHGGPAVGRAQLPGSLIGHTGTHAVAKKTEWHVHQRLKNMRQQRHERTHGDERVFVETRCTAGQLHGTEIEFGRHQAPQRSVKRGISRSVRKAEKAAANDSAFIPKWNPPVECHSVTRSQSSGLAGTVPDQMIMHKLGPVSEPPDRMPNQVAAANGAR
jgi:hypothetical protein